MLVVRLQSAGLHHGLAGKHVQSTELCWRDVQNAWRSRKNAALMLDHIDAFFGEALSAGPPNGWEVCSMLHSYSLTAPNVHARLDILLRCHPHCTFHISPHSQSATGGFRKSTQRCQTSSQCDIMREDARKYMHT